MYTVYSMVALTSVSICSSAGTESTRRDIFGDANPSLEVLTDESRKVVLMSRRTL